MQFQNIMTVIFIIQLKTKRKYIFEKSNLRKLIIAYNKNTYPAVIYLFDFNNGNIRTICEIHSKLTINVSENMVLLLIILNRFHTLL